MKKLSLLIIALLLIVSVLASCSQLNDVLGNKPGNDDTSDDGTLPGGGENTDDPSQGGDNTDDPSQGGDNTDDPSQGGDNTDDPSQGGDNTEHTYNDFTESEKADIAELLGEVIPFIPNDEYYVEFYTDDGENGVNFYTFDNTEAEFEAYLALFAAYADDGTDVDEFGDTWYFFSKGDFYVDLSYYETYDGYVVDVYAYLLDESTDEPGDGDNTEHTYNDFTESEKADIAELLGEVIPFIPNDDYYVEFYSENGENGVNFYTFDNTEAEFEAYLALFAAYTNDGTDVDEYGDTWYFFSKGDFYVDLSYYEYEGYYVVDVYAYLLDESTDEPGDGDNTEHTYNDFTESEKADIAELLGEVIPFIPNDEYYVEFYTEDGENGVHFYAFDNTEAEFEAYLALFAAYTDDGTDVDEYGDTWYLFSKGDFYVDLSYYEYEGYYVVDVYAYLLDESTDEPGDNPGGDSTPDADIITNDGKGLPEGTDGVFDIDFTEATNVKDVTDQGYYLDGCPTVGTPGVLVIPVDFSDITAESKGYDISVIEKAFLKDGAADYYSVFDYYYISSYGKLELDITVLDFWFRPSNTSEYYKNATMSYYGTEIDIGDQMILNEALAYLDTFMDLSEFDSDGNGIIDAVVLISTVDVGEDNFNWAYRYWNFYTDDNGEYYEYDGVSANDYLWASYQFLNEGYDEDGNVGYDYTDAVNTYTFIHEFGHILGADDYYDTAYVVSPMGGCDVMDSMSGDHNAYTKFNFGWITSSRLVTTDSQVTLTLESFEATGDTIIIANNWDPSLGAYQEYFIVVYYKSEGLNSGDGGYFSRDGIIVYHVNASLYKEEYDGEVYYDVYNNNTDPSDSYGTEDNLIEYVLSAEEHYTYVAGESLPETHLDNGEALIYTFTVDSIDADSATLTFSVAA